MKDVKTVITSLRDAYIKAGMKPKFLYIDRNSWKHLRQELVGDLGPWRERDVTGKPYALDLTVILVDEPCWVAIGVTL